MTEFNAVNDVVFLKLDHEDVVTEGGFIIPSHTQPVPDFGVVVAAGPGAYDSHGRLIPMPVKVGDTVYFNKAAASGVKIDNVEYVSLPVSGIHMIVEKEDN